jgi:hypothetical protein
VETAQTHEGDDDHELKKERDSCDSKFSPERRGNGGEEHEVRITRWYGHVIQVQLPPNLLSWLSSMAVVSSSRSDFDGTR